MDRATPGRVARQSLVDLCEVAPDDRFRPDRVARVKPLRVTDAEAVALDRDETRALLLAARDHRLGAAVAMLFLQGWRVSEVLGLACGPRL